jgi:hypothetical protein
MYGLRKWIRMESRVRKVQWVEDHAGGEGEADGGIWKVQIDEAPRSQPSTSKNAPLAPQTETETTHYAHHLVIANGHYRVPHYPALPGLEEWRTRTGRDHQHGREVPVVDHAVWYREPYLDFEHVGYEEGDTPARFRPKTVAIVGGGPSGRDIVHDYLNAIRERMPSFSPSLSSPPARQNYDNHSHGSHQEKFKVVWCVRGQEDTEGSDDGTLVKRGGVRAFLTRPRAQPASQSAKRDPNNEGDVELHLEFENRTTYGPIDRVILATGYDLSFPFFDSESEEDTPYPKPDSNPLMGKGLPFIRKTGKGKEGEKGGWRLPTRLLNNGSSVFPLARVLWALPDPTPTPPSTFQPREMIESDPTRRLPTNPSSFTDSCTAAADSSTLASASTSSRSSNILEPISSSSATTSPPTPSRPSKFPPPHTLSFIGLPIKVAPFPLMEAQIQAVLHAFRDPGSVDWEGERECIMKRWRSVREQVGGGTLSSDLVVGDGEDGGVVVKENGSHIMGGEEDDEQTHWAIGHSWNIFRDGRDGPGMEQFDYRDELYEFAFEDRDSNSNSNPHANGPRKVPRWTKAAYRTKDILRARWREIEATGPGEVERWLKPGGVPVGEGGNGDWVRLMEKLVGETWVME